MSWWPGLAALAGAAVLGVAIPLLAVRMLVPTLLSSESASTVNYAGRRVHYGLGVVWLVWAGCAIGAGVAASAFGPSQVLALLTVAGPLALVAFALGVVDDAYGSSADKGFRGHIRAFVSGRLTTGGLKLLGVGTASFVVAWVSSQAAPWGRELGGSLSVGAIAWSLVAGASIALTSNLLNLMDLRPGRALKAYSALVVPAVAVCTIGLTSGPLREIGAGMLAIQALALAVFMLGPVVAVWRYDLGEVAMLGDAGANPMGAVAGFVMVTGLGPSALVVYFLVVLALNVASERVSFSRVIASNRVLSWLDGLGRRADSAASIDPEKSSPHGGVFDE